MAKFDEGDLYGVCALDGHKYATYFSFRSQGHDVLDRVAHDVYGYIVHCVGMFGRVVAEDVPGGGAGMGFW